MYFITTVYENIKMMRKVADMNFKDLSPKYPPPFGSLSEAAGGRLCRLKAVQNAKPYM